MSFVFKYIFGQVKLHIHNASAFPSVFTLYVVIVRSVFYNSPDLKKWDYTGFGSSVIPSVCHDFVSAQYLENKLIELLPNFVYALILTISRWRVLHVVFRIFLTELWPLTDIRMLFRIFFPLNILRTN